MNSNSDLVQKLISDKTLITPRIISAFKAIDRKDFVLTEDKDRAYEDRPLPIGFGATISQPTTVAFMLEKLQPGQNDKILEIGAGSGYMTALLAQIIGLPPHSQVSGGGKVFSIEYIPELKGLAEFNLKSYNFRNIALFTGDGKIGLRGYAPFDKIISSASGAEIPKAWKDELYVGGRIVAPLDGYLVVLDKLSKRRFREERLKGFIFVPLQ